MTPFSRLAVKRGAQGVGLILLSLAALFANLNFENAVLRLETPSKEPIELPPDWALSAAALNYNTFASDIFWVMTLVDFGESIRDNVSPPHLLSNGHILANLDPQFRRLYDWFPNTAAARLGRASEEEITEINDFIDRGIKNFPAEGDLPFAAAMNYIGYSSDAPKPRRLRETERAIAYLERASQLDGAPNTTPFVLGWFLERRQRLLGDDADEAADRQRRIEMLSRSLLTVDDELMRERIRTELERLGAQDSVAVTARKFEEKFQYERAESPLRFLPGDLWMTVALP